MELQALQALVEEFQKLPGIGHRTAERLAYFILRCEKGEALGLAEAIRSVKEDLRDCRTCHSIAEAELCSICADESRDRSQICVVEQPKDLYAIEQSGSYSGVYHVLQGVFSPLEGVSPKDLTIKSLLARLKPGDVKEVILATNPNFEGEGTAHYLNDQLKSLGERSQGGFQITRLARGMPSGSNLEYVSRNIVSDALEGRREMS